MQYMCIYIITVHSTHISEMKMGITKPVEAKKSKTCCQVQDASSTRSVTILNINCFPRNGPQVRLGLRLCVCACEGV